jgi:hypothetical protein
MTSFETHKDAINAIIQEAIKPLMELIKKQQLEIDELKSHPKKATYASFFDPPKDPSIKHTISEAEQNVLNALNTETNHQKKKEKNVIIFGLEEGSTSNIDDKNISNLLKSINIDSNLVHKTTRFTNKSNVHSDKPGLVLVEFKSKETVQIALKANKALRNNNNNNKTFINQDLTISQRNQFKSLNELKLKKNKELQKDSDEIWVIRNFNLIKIKKNNKERRSNLSNEQQ